MVRTMQRPSATTAPSPSRASICRPRWGPCGSSGRSPCGATTRSTTPRGGALASALRGTPMPHGQTMSLRLGPLTLVVLLKLRPARTTTRTWPGTTSQAAGHSPPWATAGASRPWRRSSVASLASSADQRPPSPRPSPPSWRPPRCRTWTARLAMGRGSRAAASGSPASAGPSSSARSESTNKNLHAGVGCLADKGLCVAFQ
mmetsp:Transcript_77568/g.250995  ORF Transcript_77568/g.250995 Transcript_77568/m.250995 type:complete len:202 (+) Transcript_77568:1038-1643(+)